MANEHRIINGLTGDGISTRHRLYMQVFVDSNHLSGSGGAYEGAFENLFKQIGLVMDYIESGEDAVNNESQRRFFESEKLPDER